MFTKFARDAAQLIIASKPHVKDPLSMIERLYFSAAYCTLSNADHGSVTGYISTQPLNTLETIISEMQEVMSNVSQPLDLQSSLTKVFPLQLLRYCNVQLSPNTRSVSLPTMEVQIYSRKAALEVAHFAQAALDSVSDMHTEKKKRIEVSSRHECDLKENTVMWIASIHPLVIFPPQFTTKVVALYVLARCHLLLKEGDKAVHYIKGALSLEPPCQYEKRAYDLDGIIPGFRLFAADTMMQVNKK